MIVLEPGHKYRLQHLCSEGHEVLMFIKRSGGAINYGPNEHPGTNTQEALRALIDRTLYLNSVLPCAETQDAVWHLRQALYCYEVRAFRRKWESLNKKPGRHDDSEAPNVYRNGFDSVPFTEYEIEKLPVGPDGHILVK